MYFVDMSFDVQYIIQQRGLEGRVVKLDRLSNKHHVSIIITFYNKELNYLRKNICLRNFEVSAERISVCNVIENWRSMAYTLPCS